MTKPHEETWEVHPLDSRCVIDKADRVIADIRAPLNENGREVSVLISAAPEMARALLLVLSSSTWMDEYGEEVTAMRAALAKAGVPLP